MPRFPSHSRISVNQSGLSKKSTEYDGWGAQNECKVDKQLLVKQAAEHWSHGAPIIKESMGKADWLSGEVGSRAGRTEKYLAKRHGRANDAARQDQGRMRMPKIRTRPVAPRASFGVNDQQRLGMAWDSLDNFMDDAAAELGAEERISETIEARLRRAARRSR